MTRGKKYTVSTLIFYVIIAILVFVGERISPSGPCVPGFGILLLLFVPLLSGAGFLFSAIGRMMGHRSLMGPTIINGCICALCLCAFYLR